MGVGKQGNLIYVTDLGLVTERLTAQINTGRARNPHLIGTARFASVNGHLDVNKCDILDLVFATSSRNHMTSEEYANVIEPSHTEVYHRTEAVIDVFSYLSTRKTLISIAI